MGQYEQRAQMPSVEIRILSPDEGERVISDLVELLNDAVNGGASVGFLAPVDPAAAESYWRSRLRELRAGTRVLLAAFDHDRVVGSVQLAFAPQQNGSHRAEVQRLLVRSSHQRRGIGSALMRQAEEAALAHGRTLLLLNTRAGDPAEALYRRLGYVAAGTIPDFARNPDGTFNTTTILYRHLNPANSPARDGRL